MLDWRIGLESRGERIRNIVPQCSIAVAAYESPVRPPTVEIVRLTPTVEILGSTPAVEIRSNTPTVEIVQGSYASLVNIDLNHR